MNCSDEILSYENIFKKNDHFGDKTKNTFSFYQGDIPVILTAPHTTRTISLKKTDEIKKSEPYTGTLSLLTREKTGCHVMVRNNCGIASTSPEAKIELLEFYKRLSNYIKINKIKYLIDIHGLPINDNRDLIVGTNNGKYIFYEDVWKEIISCSFEIYGIDVDFNTKYQTNNSKTISQSIFDINNIKTTQFEINNKFRTPKSNIKDFQELLWGLCTCVEEINNELSLEK